MNSNGSVRRWLVLALAAGPACVSPSVQAVPIALRQGVEAEPGHEVDVPVEARAWPDVAMEDRGRGFVVAEHDLFVELALEAERCVLVDVALPHGVRDADLEAYDDEGRTLAVDRAADRFAALLLCAGRPSRVHVRAVAADGAGELRVRAAAVDPALAALGAVAADARWDARTATAGEAARFAARVAGAFRPRGFTVVEGPHEARAGADPMLFAIATRAEECVAVVARVTGPTQSSLVLRPNGGNASVRDEGTGRDLVVETCAPPHADATVRIDAEQGADVMWVVLRGDARTIGGRASLRFGRVDDEP